MQFFDFANPLTRYEGNLPHWRQEGVIYFVTFRLADAIPQNKLEQWQFERENWHIAHREPYTAEELEEHHFLFSERVQEWLDSGHGSCILGRSEIRRLVEESLLHYNNQQYLLDEYIVMPNHVHVLVTPLDGFLLEKIVGAWKSFTAHRINKHCGTTGQVWQHESYDHCVRNEKQLKALREYIKNNPKLKK